MNERNSIQQSDIDHAKKDEYRRLCKLLTVRAKDGTLFTDIKSTDEDKDFIDACKSALIEHHGLEQWAKAVLFDPIPPSYLIVEAVTEDVGADGKPAIMTGHNDFKILKNSQNPFYIDGNLFGCQVVREICLMPTERNQIRVEADNKGYITLTLDLKPGISISPPENESDPEFYIYCDPGNPPDFEIVEAFQTLVSGRWEFSDKQIFPFPLNGVSSVWISKDRAKYGVNSADLLNQIACPFAMRFLRLSLSPIQELIKKNPNEAVKLKVFAGSQKIAEKVSEKLDNNLKLNHLLIWNRIIRQNDKPRERPFSLTIDGRATGCLPLILDVRDKLTGTHYYDSDWNTHVDPSLLFSVKMQDDKKSFDLGFQGKAPSNDHLEIFYLIPADWTTHEIDLKKTTGKMAEQSFAIREYALFSEKTKEQDKKERLALSWLAHAVSLTPRQAVTRRDVALLIQEMIPKPLSDIVDFHPDDPLLGISMKNVLKPVRISQESPPHAYPVTVITLPCKKNYDMKTDYSHFLQWVERNIEKRCVVGTHLEIKLNTYK